jgi:hypothetical protein
MKATTLKKAAIFAGSLSFLAGAAFSQSAVSGAGGYRTQNLGQGFNVVGVNLHNPVVSGGSITAEADAVVTVDNDLAAVDAAAATYIFEVTDGDQKGAIAEIVSVDAGAGTVTLDGALGAGVGSAYSIRKAPTLNETFGDLTGGPTAATADNVYIPTGNPAPANFDIFFKSSVSGNFRKAGAFSDPAKPVSFLYSDAVLVERKSADPLPLVITGMVKTVGTVVNVTQGFAPVAVSAPVGGTLQSSGLTAFLTAGPTAATADVIYVPTAPGAFDLYFTSSVSGNIRKAGAFADAADVPVDNGLLIERKSAGTAGLYDVPSYYEAL